ncbi:unnamed protein product [Effrenium voratum]|uniref:DNA polymerase delta catalytic subunit n=1 Tax=Effrenium voratum TaxID=2562239 RepID=A0AA36I267_9DINO|nr:unnamed protein product [Effrenium voratum]
MAGVIDLDDAIEDAAVLIQTPLRRVRRPDITPNNPPRRAASASAIAPASKRPRGEEPKPEPWRRSGSVPLDRQAFETGALALLLVSLEDRLMLPVPGFDGGPASPAGAYRNQQRCEGSVPVLDLHGVTPEGASVLLHVHGFRPYFYAQRPSEEVNLKVCLEALDRAVRSKDGGIELLEEVERTPIMNYQPNSERFIRVVMSSPKIQTNCKTALERGVPLGQGITWKSQAFEVVALQQRFLADLSGAGGAWLEAPAGRFRLRPQQHLPRSSLAQLEADTHYSCLQAHAPEGRWLQLAPLRLLSLHLRTREEGRICAAACVLRTHGFDSELSAAWAVAAGAEASAGGATGGARMVGSEEELLQQLRDFLHAADPDIILGYDLLNGHLSSAITRAAALKLGAAPGNKGGGLCLGRLCGQPSRVKNSTFETRQLGKHETKDITAEGRLLFDLLRVTEMEHKLSSYTLSALALHFLKESRLELGAADLEKLSREDPRKLAEMTRRDAGLSMQLFYQQHCLFRYVEMARVTGVPMEYLLTRGQSVKVLSMLLRKARLHGYVLPPQTRYSNGMDEGGNTYEGGAVLDPLSGFYDEPVVTLDFASLYPSIMQKHNLCYSTIIRATAPPMMDGLESLEQVVPGLGHRFVSSKVRRGLVPMVLEELLTARARAKKELKQVPPGDTQLRAVLDGRQLALKISANSVYGFTGMANGPLPCQAIAASVTAYGRQMIETAKVRSADLGGIWERCIGSDETLHPEPDEKAGGSNGSGAVGSGAAAARRLRPLGQSEPTEMETCPICLDVLCCQPLGVCVDSCGRRSCGHFFHLSCLERVEGAHCPQCRTRFTLRAPVPNLGDAWVRLVAPQGLRRDVAAGLRACLELPHEEVDRLLSPASDVLEPDVLAELLQVAQDFLPKSLEEIPAKARDGKVTWSRRQRDAGASVVACTFGVGTGCAPGLPRQYGADTEEVVEISPTPDGPPIPFTIAELAEQTGSTEAELREFLSGRWDEVRPRQPGEGMDGELLALLADKPGALTKFFEDCGVQSCSDVRYSWANGGAMVAAYEARYGAVSAEGAFQVMMVYSLASGQATLQKAFAVRRLVDERESVIVGRPALSLQAAPAFQGSQKSRPVIETGLSERVPNLIEAAAADPYTKEKARKQMKTQALFQFVVYNLVDLAELGVTWEALNDPARVEALRESLMACTVRLSLEQVGALLSSVKRWARFAQSKGYSVRTTPLQLAEFLKDVGSGGPTAAASMYQAHSM